MLFATNKTRNDTQVAYFATYSRNSSLTDNIGKAAKSLIVWSRLQIYKKATLIEHLNENMTRLNFMGQEWQLRWEDNAIPTKEEWDKKTSGFLIRVEYKVVKTAGRIALLSFRL